MGVGRRGGGGGARGPLAPPNVWIGGGGGLAPNNLPKNDYKALTYLSGWERGVCVPSQRICKLFLLFY